MVSVILIRGVSAAASVSADGAQRGDAAVVSESTTARFRSDIEGLRAVAVLAVVLFHAGVPGVSGGFIGVDVFFVISGFLITGMLWREVLEHNTIELRRFYGARARRLLPASALVGAFTVVCSVCLMNPLEAHQAVLDALSCALYVGNYGFALQGTDYLSASAPPSPFQHYWSLCVEEQFYLVWAPLLLVVAWLCHKVGSPRKPTRGPFVAALAVIGASSFAFSLHQTQTSPSWAFFSLPTRAWELAAGGLLALTAQFWQRLPSGVALLAGWAGLLVVLVGCTRLGAMTPYPGTAALVPVIGSALIIAAGCARSTFGAARGLALRPLRAVGRISYSWYLWHWPVLLLAPLLLGHPLGLSSRLSAAGIAALFAVMTLHLLENPVRFWPSVRLSPNRSLAVGAASTAVALTTAAVLMLVLPPAVGTGAAAPAMRVTVSMPLPGSDVRQFDTAVERAYTQVRRAITASADRTAVPSNLDPPLAHASDDRGSILVNGCLRSYDQIDQPQCVTGDQLSRTTVVLVGDSHATTWSPAFRQAAEQNHWRLETMGKEACPFMDLPLSYPRLHRPYHECGQWRRNIMDRLRHEHPQLVVLSMNRAYGPGYTFTPYSAEWLEDLAATVRVLRSIGSGVMVVSPVPNPRTTAPSCLSAHLEDMTACWPRRSLAVNASGVTAEATATQANGGVYVDVTDLFCDAEQCPTVIGDTLVYRDDNHATMQYVRHLAPVLGAVVGRALAGESER